MTDFSQMDSESPVSMEYQGIGIRFVSLVIDSLVISAVFGVLGSILGFNAMSQSSWSLGLLSFAFYIAYYTYLEGSRGQTIGKMITRIKVVSEDGGPISMDQAFKRNILRIIDGLFAYLIGAVLIWRSDKQQRLGDSYARTVVVKA